MAHAHIMPRWRGPYDKAVAAGRRVAAVDRGGHVLAVANWNSHLPAAANAYLGHRWQEFVHPADLPPIMAWYATTPPDPGMPLAYRRMAPGGMYWTVGHKEWAGDAWLVYGVTVERMDHGGHLPPINHVDRMVLHGILAGMVQQGPIDTTPEELEYMGRLTLLMRKLAE